MTLSERGAYWGAVVALAATMIIAVMVATDRLFGSLDRLQNGIAASGIFTLLYTPLLWLLAHGMTGEKRDSITPFWLMILIVLIVSVVITQSRNHLIRQHAPVRARLFSRLSDKATREIYRVTVRDHHVDIFTDRGMETLLMRFADAIAELDGIKGNQVHRSHWVASDAMVKLGREKGRYYLALKGGGQVPVSRSHREKIEENFA